MCLFLHWNGGMLKSWGVRKHLCSAGIIGAAKVSSLALFEHRKQKKEFKVEL